MIQTLIIFAVTFIAAVAHQMVIIHFAGPQARCIDCGALVRSVVQVSICGECIERRRW